MNIKRLLSFVALLSMVSMHTNAQEKLDILDVFDQFLLANHAASQCTKPDRDTLTRFLANFQMVWIRTGEEIQKRNPKFSKEDAGKLMKARSDLQNQRVSDIVKSNGCKDPRIDDLLKRFQIQANLKFGK